MSRPKKPTTRKSTPRKVVRKPATIEIAGKTLEPLSRDDTTAMLFMAMARFDGLAQLLIKRGHFTVADLVSEIEHSITNRADVIAGMMQPTEE
jgi:hypothetical protein